MMLVVAVMTATPISESVTPVAETGTFFFWSAALTSWMPPGTVVPVGLSDDFADSEFPHAAAIRTIATPAATTRARILPPGNFRVPKADANVTDRAPQGTPVPYWGQLLGDTFMT